MYQWFSQISNLFSEPFFSLANQWESIPILFALLLGVVGSVAPCQLTGNIGAITLYGNRSLQRNFPWSHILLFILGKIVVFSLLGLMVWLIGSGIEKQFTTYIPFLRKSIGPLIILIGVFLAGFIKFHKNITIWKVPEKYLKEGRWGSFLMGVSFTLAFCPTMFVLFFLTLMPIVVSTSYGMVLPGIFGIGTSVPLLLFIFLIWYFGLGGTFMKKSRNVGRVIQKLAGWILIIIGILDTLAYWG
ncbi:urease accessory protein UreH domain-containing protein [Thalassobacillus hwangdonensis]|uniref:Sulfite exporter TauE/SafE family protein n=1 Tax=Thalassobacillus hwangdonensis TaxID=546108 RepID=A0ABW3L2X5_9BACI